MGKSVYPHFQYNYTGPRTASLYHYTTTIDRRRIYVVIGLNLCCVFVGDMYGLFDLLQLLLRLGREVRDDTRIQYLCYVLV